MNGNDDTTFDDEVMAKAAQLATAVSPERDLWPGIEQAIAVPAGRRRTMWNTVWAQAAAVVVLVGGSSGLTYLAVNSDENAAVPLVAESPVLAFAPVSGSFGSQYNLGPDYIDARRVLTEKLNERLEMLSPEERADILANIETIRKAIADINLALADDPDNVLLQELLINTYRDELSVMRQVDGISSAAMYREDF